MPRPKKAIVDYFPHFTNNGKTIYILESKFKNDGYSFWFKILEILGRTEHHYINCNEKSTWEFLLAKSLLDESVAIEIIDLLAELGAIDGELWQKKIIRSDNFIRNLSTVYQRRGINVITKPQLMGFLSTKTPLNGINVNINPTSIVKESKGKKSKGDSQDKLEQQKTKFQELTGIPITNDKTFKETLKILKKQEIEINDFAGRVNLYFQECKAKNWGFVFAKRWNKVFENVDVFISIDNLNGYFEKMVDWNKKKTNQPFDYFRNSSGKPT